MGIYKDLTNQTFGKLTVKEFSHFGKNSKSYWKCQCSCGNPVLVIVGGSELKQNNTKSCGCIKKEILFKRNFKHGKCKSKVYNSWQAMLTRCYNPNDEFYLNYGGRGIIVCEQWKNFEEFYKNMGDPPLNLTIERIDSDGNYCPENCRWATQKEQANNRRNNRWIEFNGEKLTLAQWSEKTGIKYSILLDRITRGWDLEKAFTTLPKSNGRPE